MRDGFAIRLADPEAAFEELWCLIEKRLDSREANQHAPWLDVEAAAHYLACKPKRIYDLVGQRRLRCSRDGRRLLFRPEDLDAALDRGGEVE